MHSNPTLCERIAKVIDQVHQCEQQSGRQKGSVTVLAVSKTKPIHLIEDAITCGITTFGENYAQELKQKVNTIGQATAEWHFIGPIQSNKSRLLANSASWIHSIARLKLIRRLAEQRLPELPALQLCLQVNIDQENTKAGVLPNELEPLADEIASFDNLRLRGLMSIPHKTAEKSEQHRAFSRVRHAFEQLKEKGHDLDTLSMGMSGDYPAAIAEGATIVRIGTSIFGPRVQ